MTGEVRSLWRENGRLYVLQVIGVLLPTLHLSTHLFLSTWQHASEHALGTAGGVLASGGHGSAEWIAAQVRWAVILFASFVSAAATFMCGLLMIPRVFARERETLPGDQRETEPLSQRRVFGLKVAGGLLPGLLLGYAMLAACGGVGVASLAMDAPPGLRGELAVGAVAALPVPLLLGMLNAGLVTLASVRAETVKDARRALWPIAALAISGAFTPLGLWIVDPERRVLETLEEVVYGASFPLVYGLFIGALGAGAVVAVLAAWARFDGGRGAR